MNKKKLKKFITKAYIDAYDKNLDYNSIGVLNHMMKYCNRNFKDNSVSSLDKSDLKTIENALIAYHYEEEDRFFLMEKLNKQNGV
jgi:hypothetical protein